MMLNVIYILNKLGLNLLVDAVRKISFYPFFIAFCVDHSSIDLILDDCKTSVGTDVFLLSLVFRNLNFLCECVCGRNAF